MKNFYVHNTIQRASGPKNEYVRQRIPNSVRVNVTQNLHDFKSDTITRNRIPPGDGCRMEVLTPPPMCAEYAGEHTHSLRRQFLLSRRLIQTPPHRNILSRKSLSGVAGGKTNLPDIQVGSFEVKLRKVRMIAKAVITKNQRNLDDTLELKSKGEISQVRVKRTVSPGYQTDRQRKTLAGCSDLPSTKILITNVETRTWISLFST